MVITSFLFIYLFRTKSHVNVREVCVHARSMGFLLTVFSALHAAQTMPHNSQSGRMRDAGFERRAAWSSMRDDDAGAEKQRDDDAAGSVCVTRDDVSVTTLRDIVVTLRDKRVSVRDILNTVQQAINKVSAVVRQ